MKVVYRVLTITFTACLLLCGGTMFAGVKWGRGHPGWTAPPAGTTRWLLTRYGLVSAEHAFAPRGSPPWTSPPPRWPEVSAWVVVSSRRKDLGTGVTTGYVYLNLLNAMVTAAIALGVSMLMQVRASRRVRPGVCRQCGYDLRASKDRCPECGTPITRSVT